MKAALRHIGFALSLLFMLGIAGSVRAAELNEADRKFLANYEAVRAALAKDDLNGAKKAAADLKEEGTPIANSDKISTARAEFTKLSQHAIQLTAGQTGFYTMHCPMLNKDWVQTSKQVSNPYAGKAMLTCGEVKP
jgi:hypothetical protein